MEKFDWKSTIKTNIFMLKMVGLWPEGNETYKFNLYTLYAMVSIALFIYGHNLFQTVNIYFIFDDLQAVVGTIFVVLEELLCIIKSYYVIQNMRILKHLMKTINNKIFQPKNERQKFLIEPSVKFWNTTSRLLWGMSMGAVFFWSTFPIMDNSVKEHRLPFLAWYPYNVEISPFYEITYIYQIVSTAFIASATLSIDTLIAALNMFIGAQCDILCDDLRHVFDCIEEYSDMDKKFINCIKHHKAILRFAHDSNQFFNWIVLVQFFSSAASIGLTMFQLTVVAPFTSEFYSIMSFGNAITVEIFMYCWFGNEVEIKSSLIQYAVFESNWTRTSLSVKKKIFFFVMRCQKPIRMSALNLFNLSVDTFMKILRTAWSYFALLHQVNSR